MGALDEVCEQPCVLNGERYGPGESFERGCNVCTCEYDMFFFETCQPFCNLTSADCAAEGQLLQNNPDECCSCVAPPTTTPVSTTTPEPTTKHEKMVPTTQPQTPEKTTTTGMMTTLMSTVSNFFTTSSEVVVEETTPATVPTTPATVPTTSANVPTTTTAEVVTTPIPICSDECTCTLGCEGEQDECGAKATCSKACACADEDSFKINGQCASWPEAEECPITSTAAILTTSVETRIEETTASTTTAPVVGTTTTAPVVGTTTTAPVEGTTTTAPVEGTTTPSTSTSAIKTTSVEPRIEETTTAPVDGTTPAGTTTTASIVSTTEASSTIAEVVTTSTLVPTTTSVAKTCSDDCRCDVTCEDQLSSDDIPARCSQVDSTCDLCTCDAGEVKDPVTRKCVKYAECKKKCVYKNVAYEDGEIYWKGDCTQCSCTSGSEQCIYDACRINQNTCEQKGQRFVQVPGTCCYCAPVVVNVTTTTVVVTTKPITEEVTTTPVEKTTAATKTTPEPATAPTTAQVDTTAEVLKTTESYTEPIDYTTTAPTTAHEATTNMTTTRSTFTTTPKSSRCIFKGIDMDRPSPNNQWSYGCTVCKCVNGEASCEKYCSIQQCRSGEKLITEVGDDECCRCEPEETTPICKYEGQDYEPGSSWEDGSCTQCSCDYYAGVVCNNARDHCTDVITSCDLETQELQYNESQCCPVCVDKPQKPDGSCKPITVSQQLLTDNGCVTEGEVTLTACGGSCSSNTTVLSYPPYIETNCHCCQPTELGEREVTTLCPGGDRSTIKIPVVMSCGCSQCEN